MAEDESSALPTFDRRGSLAAFGALMTVGSGSAEINKDTSDPKPVKATGPLNPASFGAPLDGVAPDEAGIQRAIDSLASATPSGGCVKLDRGPVVISQPLDMKSDVDLDFGRAAVILQSEGGYAIGVGWSPSSPMISLATIRGRSFLVKGSNQTAIAIRNGSGTQILESDFALRSPGQTGIRVVANDAPLGPYYGLIDNVRIYGTNSPGQRGIVLEQKYAPGSIGINRWNFSNIRHLAALEIGLDVQGVDGVVFNGINFEACFGRAARFGYGSRTFRGRITANGGQNASFTSTDIRGMAFDPVGAITMLTGKNAGESMVARQIDPRTGNIVFLAAFPEFFAIGDTFLFTENKCRSVTILNATNEGGDNENEVGFEFLAGSRDCRVQLAMTTMAKGYYFKREIEDESNTIARRVETISYYAELDAQPGQVWLPEDGHSLSRGGSVTHGTCWVDAIYITGSKGAGGTITAEVFANSVNQDLAARLTVASPFFGRKIRRELRANSLLGPYQHLKVRVTKANTKTPEAVRVDIVLGYI